MEIKILQVFYGKDGLPYKDKDRQVHFPIAGTGFLGASNTTKIKFYYDELDNLDETTWVAVSKLPNGKVGSRVLESYLDEELNEHYALLELDSYYTQYKGDVFISLQGYQGGVNVDYNEETGLYEIHGTPTIAATGSVKFTINYANQFVGSGETDNINFQRVLAVLGTKLGMRADSKHVSHLPSVGDPNIFYVINNDEDDPTKQNIYIWNENTQKYVWVGDNTLDLNDYYKKYEIDFYEENTNAKIDSLSNEIAQLNAQLGTTISGSPKGVYATVSALQTANPDHDYIYVVLADNKWYYWNGTQWTAGNTYLAGSYDTDLDEESINAVENQAISKELDKTMQHIVVSGESSQGYFLKVFIKSGSKYRITNNTNGIIYSSSYDATDGQAIESFPDANPNSVVEFVANNNAKYIQLYFASSGTGTFDNLSTHYQEEIDNLKNTIQQHFEINGVASTNYWIYVDGKAGTKYRIKNNSDGILYAGLFSASDSRIESFPDIPSNGEIEVELNYDGAYIKVYLSTNGSCEIDNLSLYYQNQIEDIKKSLKKIDEVHYVDGLEETGYYLYVDGKAGTSYKIVNNTNGIIYAGSYNSIGGARIDVLPDTLPGTTSSFTLEHDCLYIQLFFMEEGNAYLENTSLHIPSQIQEIFDKIDGSSFLPVKEKKELFPLTDFAVLGTIFDTSEYEEGDWREQYVGLGYDVVYNETDSKYYMLYSGNNGIVSQIGLATSTDLVTWTDYGSNPVLESSNNSGDYDYGGATFPQLLWFDNKWIMFYVAFDERGFEQGNHYIAYAESTDLIHWTKKGILISKQNFADAGYNFNVFYRPRVRCFYGRYYMFINAGVEDAAPFGADESVYVLVAYNPLGEWKVIGCAVDAKVESASSNYKMCADPDVIFNGNIFLMCYWGGGRGIRWSYSTPHEFPLVWHEFEDLETSGGRPLLIPVGEKVYMIYNDSVATIVKVKVSNVVSPNKL